MKWPLQTTEFSSRSPYLCIGSTLRVAGLVRQRLLLAGRIDRYLKVLEG